MDDGDNTPSAALAGAPMLLRHDRGGWELPATTKWTNESELRDLIAMNPSLIPGVDPAAAAVTEFAVPAAGRADIVIIDPSGEITVVEAKLETNPDIRRTVVGQALAYAAAISEMPIDDFIGRWGTRYGTSPAVAILATEADPAEVDELHERIRANLSAGSMRIVVAVDRLTSELRSTIAYLAAHTTDDVELLALEVAYAKHDGIEILVPRVYGSGLKPSRATPNDSSRVAVATARDHVLGTLAEQPTGSAEAIGTVLDLLGDRIAYLYFGNADQLDPVLVVDEPVHCQPLKVYTTGSKAGLRVCFHWMLALGTDRLQSLLDELSSDQRVAECLKGVAAAGFRKRPTIPFDLLVQPGVAAHVATSVCHALDAAGGS